MGLLHPGPAAPPDHPSALLPTPPSFLGSAPHPLCSQNGNQENPSCCGIDGILEAYHHSLRTVQLYGPTNFAPVVPGSGRSPGVGSSNPLQHSCLEISMDRGVRQVTVHRITHSQTHTVSLGNFLCQLTPVIL